MVDTSLTVIETGEAREATVLREWLNNQTSKETRKAYEADLRGFLAWIAAHGLTSLGDVERSHIIAYRDWLKNNGAKVTTIARHLSVVRQALHELHAEGLIPANPAKLVKAYHVPDVSPRHALDNVMVRALLAQPNRRTLIGARDYAMLCLLLYLGLRRSEVAALRMGSIGRERAHNTLRVEGKGDKVRLLPLPPVVMQAISEYLVMADRTDEGDAAMPLFLGTRTHNGVVVLDHLDSDTVWRRVKRYATRAGLTMADVHTLRLTAITNALDNGASLRRVQAMAGHSDPKTTARYDSRRGSLDDSAVYRVNY